ncbi:MAG: hypothetical protein JJT90_03430 [Ectothiorhodospiraceae bacterium]|nr:hypothetical protein [Ectothiorhodospiraceae bacterium]
MTQALNLNHFGDADEDPRLLMSLIGGVAAVMLLIGTLHLQETHGGLQAGSQSPIFERVMEWRPQGPPPAFDADQLTPEEVEQPAVVASSGGGGEASGRDSGNLRARPER